MTYMAKRKRSSASAAAQSGAKEEEEAPPPGTMPTPTEADAALAAAGADGENDDDPLGPWRSVVLRALSYGTDYDARSSPRNGKKEQLKDLDVRAEEAARFVAEALGRSEEDDKGKGTSDDKGGEGEEGGGTAPSSLSSSLQGVVADAFWLVGCMLEPSVAAAAASADGDKGNEEAEEKRKASFAALSKVVSLLAFGSPSDGADGGSAAAVPIPPCVPIRTLRTTLEPSLLSSSGLLPSAGLPMTKRLAKLNTDMFYRQRKFNLLQEESEGYAKLLTLLSGLPGGVVSTTDEAATGKVVAGGGGGSAATAANAEKGNSAAVSSASAGSGSSGSDPNDDNPVHRVRELVGAFDLDPNRVLDLTLDALEGEVKSALRRADDRSRLDGTPTKTLGEVFRHAPGQAGAVRALLRIVSTFRAESVPHLLGVKFASYSSRDLPADASAAAAGAAASKKAPVGKAALAAGAGDLDKRHKNDGPTPRSLYATAALLHLHGALDVPALVPHLAPPSSDLMGAYKEYQAEYGKKIRKMGTVSLNASAAASEEKKSDDAAAAAAASATTATDKSDEGGSPASPLEDNQILGLFDALIESGSDWEGATSVFGGTSVHRSEMAAAVCALNEETGRRVCRWISDAITPAYDAKVNNVGAELLRRPPPALNGGKARGASGSGGGFGGTGSAETPGRASMGTAVALASAKSPTGAGGRPSTAPAALGRSMSVVSVSGGGTNSSCASSSFSLLPSSGGSGSSGPGGKAALLGPDCVLPDAVSVLSGPLSAIAEAGSVRHDPILYCRLCRLIGAMLRSQDALAKSQGGGGNDEEGVDIHGGTYDLLRTFLVPSLSMFSCNPSLASELWNVLSLLPYRVRYGLYGAWKGDGLEKAALRARTMGMGGRRGGKRKPLPNIESEVETGLSARYTLKRLSKDNIRDMGRRLSKASHRNPLVVFTAILNQIESYDNLILMMVETFRYVTLLSLDVIGYCTLISLGGGPKTGLGRSKLKADGVNAAQWLSSLETFTGALFKKFPDVELRGILSYILNRLRDGQVLELGVLRTLLKTAGGYGFADCESTASLSEVQLEGRSGSLLLRRETSDFGIVEKTSRRAAVRLRSILQGGGGTGVAALLLLAQIRPRLLYGGSGGAGKKEHIKLIGNLYDNCQMVMGVLLDFLTDGADDQFEQGAAAAAAAATSTSAARTGAQDGTVTGAVAKYARSLPTLRELHDDYGIDPAAAWMLCRPLIRAAMSAAEEMAKNGAKAAKKVTNADDDEKTNDGGGAQSNGDSSSAVVALPPHLAPYAPGSDDSKAACRTMLPDIAWRSISLGLFEAFYSHSLYDIHCPELRYTTEINRLRKEADRLSQLKKGGSAAAATMSALAAAAAAAGGTYREIRQATAFTKEHQADLDRVTRSAEALNADLKKQKAHCEAVKKTLETQAKAFLSDLSNITEGDEAIDLISSTPDVFLTYCVYPRALLSPEDASYCSFFVELLHRMETPGFSTLTYLGKLVHAIVGALYSITEDEAGNLSLLLESTWKVASDWRYNEDKFKEEVHGKPGSMMTDDATGKAAPVSFDKYKELYNCWHAVLGDALVGGLKSSEYMHTRASLIMLTRVVRVYPTRAVVGECILKALQPLQEDNARQDIKAAAQGYGSMLIKARDDGGVWREQDAAAARARAEREKKAVEERKKKLEKQNEEMKEESERITRQIGDGRSRGYDDRHRSHLPRGVEPSRGGYVSDRRLNRSPLLNPSAATFTPAGGGHARELGRGGGASAAEPRDSRDHPPRGDWERGRGGDYRGTDSSSGRRTVRDNRDHHHSEPPRSMKWERGGGDERGGGGASQHATPSSDARASDRGRGGYADDRRPPHGGAGAGRSAPPPSGGAERGGGGSGGLGGRWVGGSTGSAQGGAHGERDGGLKRVRSPEADRDGSGTAGSGPDRARDGEQPKRMRTDQAPPRDRVGPLPSRSGDRGPPHSDARRGDVGYGRTSPHSGRSGPPPLSDRDGARRSDRRSRR